MYTSVLFFVCVWNRWSLRFLFANNFRPRARFAKRCKFYRGSPKLELICYNLNRSTPKTTSSSIFETIDRPTELFGRHLSAGFFWISKHFRNRRIRIRTVTTCRLWDCDIFVVCELFYVWKERSCDDFSVEEAWFLEMSRQTI